MSWRESRSQSGELFSPSSQDVSSEHVGRLWRWRGDWRDLKGHNRLQGEHSGCIAGAHLLRNKTTWGVWPVHLPQPAPASAALAVIVRQLPCTNLTPPSLNVTLFPFQKKARKLGWWSGLERSHLQMQICQSQLGAGAWVSWGEALHRRFSW